MLIRIFSIVLCSVIYIISMANVTESARRIVFPLPFVINKANCCGNEQKHENFSKVAKASSEENRYSSRADYAMKTLTNVEEDKQIQINDLLRQILEMKNERIGTSHLMSESGSSSFIREASALVATQSFGSHEASKDEEETNVLACTQLECSDIENHGVICACNYNTGNVVSFKNQCDLKKHNCRFFTDFRVIMNDVCPWQFESRSADHVFDYSNPSYYN